MYVMWSSSTAKATWTWWFESRWVAILIRPPDRSPTSTTYRRIVMHVTCPINVRSTPLVRLITIDLYYLSISFFSYYSWQLILTELRNGIIVCDVSKIQDPMISIVQRLKEGGGEARFPSPLPMRILMFTCLHTRIKYHLETDKESKGNTFRM